MWEMGDRIYMLSVWLYVLNTLILGVGCGFTLACALWLSAVMSHVQSL